MPKPAAHDAEGLLSLHREKVPPEWIDFNGHMNVASYVLAFDHATDALLDHLGLGVAYLKRSRCSMFILEAHVTYEQEVMEGDELRFTTRVLDADGKRMHLFHGMYVGERGVLAATNELVNIHVDMRTRRSAPLPVAAVERIEPLVAAGQGMPWPSRAGRVIALKKVREG